VTTSGTGTGVARTDAERAYLELKRRIVTTAMRPGAVIDEGALVADLGLGRTPVREALKRLEVERLVVVLPRRGMYVADVTLPELRELEEVRLGLEVLCARLAVQRFTPAQIEELEAALVERARGEAPDVSELEADRRLHAIVWRASNNALLGAECERLFNLSMRMWYLIVERLDRSDLHEEMFPEILAAARDRDEPRAEAAVRRHIEQFGASVRRHL
jgi:DNA-binding GntR family transcriptional regulator